MMQYHNIGTNTNYSVSKALYFLPNFAMMADMLPTDPQPPNLSLAQP